MSYNERFVLLLCGLLLVTFVYVLVTPLSVQTAPAAHTLRNQWGQQPPLDFDELCEATILQWTPRCEQAE